MGKPFTRGVEGLLIIHHVHDEWGNRGRREDYKVLSCITGHTLTRWLARPCVDWRQGWLLLASRTRALRKREEVDIIRKVCLREKIELYVIWLWSFVYYLFPDLTISNFNHLCGRGWIHLALFLNTQRVYPLDLMFIWQQWYHIQTTSMPILQDKLSRNAPVT